MGIWECGMYGNMGMYVWEYVCMYVWEYVCMYVWEYGNVVCMGIWECEGYSTHISATAELVFSAYIIFYYY